MVTQKEKQLCFSPAVFGDLAYVLWGIQDVIVSKPAFWGISLVSVYLQHEIKVCAHNWNKQGFNGLWQTGLARGALIPMS